MKNDFFKYNLENNELFHYLFLRLNDTFSIFCLVFPQEIVMAEKGYMFLLGIFLTKLGLKEALVRQQS
jgi:hypothetical protein